MPRMYPAHDTPSSPSSGRVHARLSAVPLNLNFLSRYPVLVHKRYGKRAGSPPLNA